MARTGGPNRIMGKAALVAGCEMRRCVGCGAGVLVPQASDWRECVPCLRGWRQPATPPSNLAAHPR